jgi:hypothetical protein
MHGLQPHPLVGRLPLESLLDQTARRCALTVAALVTRIALVMDAVVARALANRKSQMQTPQRS